MHSPPKSNNTERQGKIGFLNITSAYTVMSISFFAGLCNQIQVRFYLGNMEKQKMEIENVIPITGEDFIAT